ncbi:MAG TPA: sulfite exporter TauE/SafE family protein [Candidatus Eisenbacteria bacterium]|nr:sulfite exporter TauE/SafE family protein [Candidatus Eisenbacteria bacterium]
MNSPQSVPATLTLRSVLRLQALLLGGFTLAGAVLIGFMRIVSPGSPFSSFDLAFDTIFSARFLYFLGAGFAAQVVDGALGMAYGVTSTSLLLSAGVTPAVASASVHVAELCTTMASGISHWRFGNVRRDLFLKLALPGAAGAALGAYVLTSFDGNLIRPYVAAYLLVMGVLILVKSVGKAFFAGRLKHVRCVALFGGFVDASGGGGWGPVVTSTLLGTGYQARATIGTVNAVEFVVALTAAGIFTLFVGITGWQVVLGLIAGGLLAAPMGAYACRNVSHRTCMILVALLIIFLSARTLIRSL